MKAFIADKNTKMEAHKNGNESNEGKRNKTY